MAREVRWERMFVDELDAALEACPVLYMPYGLCEPHGPQSALGNDGLRAWAFTRRAAERFGGIVAPPFFWNVHGYGIYSVWGQAVIGSRRNWLTPLPPWMFFKNICYHVRAADALGFHAIVLFSGHSGPHAHDLPQLQELLQPHFATRLCFLLDGAFPEVWAGSSGHGGKVETAMLWAGFPDCVDLSRLPEAEAPGPHFAMGADARETSRRHGEEIIEHVAAGLGNKAQELLAEYDRLQPARREVTYDEIEELWATVIRPWLPQCRSMQDLAEGQTPPPEDSLWYPNWRVPRREDL